MEIGNQVPPVQFKATNGVNTTLDSYRGQWLVIYFYPKDATPGCTIEGCDFCDHEKDFSLLNATIMGVSRDGLSSHEKFKANQNFPFELISDPDETLCQLFDVIKMGNRLEELNVARFSLILTVYYATFGVRST